MRERFVGLMGVGGRPSLGREGLGFGVELGGLLSPTIVDLGEKVLLELLEASEDLGFKVLGLLDD